MEIISPVTFMAYHPRGTENPGGGCWGGFFALGLALSITAATSNVDSWRMHLELTCLRRGTMGRWRFEPKNMVIIDGTW